MQNTLPHSTKPSTQPRLSRLLGSVWSFLWRSFRLVYAGCMRLWSGMFRLPFWSLWVCCFALGVSIAGIGNDPLWYDESFTARLARLDLPHMFTAIAGDVHPPLYYMIEWVTGHLFGYSEIALRMPSLVFGVGGVAMLYHTVRSIAGDREGRLASLMWAMMPAGINYAQEARGYSLLVLLVFGGLYAAHKGRWRLLAVIVAAMLLTHNLSVFYSGVIGVVAASKSLGRTIRACFGAGVLYAPWAIVAFQQMQAVRSGFWIAPQTFGAIPYALVYTTLFSRWPPAAAFSVIMLVCGLSAVALWSLRSDFRKLAPLIALVAVPPAAMFAVSAIWKPIFLDRGLLPSGAGMVATWAIALVRMRLPDRLTAAAILAPVMVSGLIGFYGNVSNDFDWTAPARIIRENSQPCDAIYHANVASYIQIDGYYPGHSYLLPEANDLSQSLTDQTKDAAGIRRDTLEHVAASHCRVWFVYVSTPLISDAEYRFSQDTLSSYPTIQRWDLYSTPLATFKLYLLRVK